MKLAPGLALRKRPEVIQKWEITLILYFVSFMFCSTVRLTSESCGMFREVCINSKSKHVLI